MKRSRKVVILGACVMMTWSLSASTPRLDELQHRALSLALEERYDEAVPLLEQVLARDPTRLPVWEALGWAYWYQERPERTRRLWEQLALIDPDEPRVHNWLASYHLRRNELTESITRYERSLELDPQQTEIRFHLAQASRWSGHLNRAVQLLESLVVRYPDRNDIRLELARALTSNWAYGDALPHWQILRAEDPDNLEYLIADATVHLHTGQTKQARTLAQQALDRVPDDLQALQVMADAMEYGDEPAQAVPWLQRMLGGADDESYRQHIRARLALLFERLYRGNRIPTYLAQAAELHAERVAIDPEHMDARLKFAEMNLLTGRYDVAAEAFQVVLDRFNPNNIRALRGLFELHLARQDWLAAESAWTAIASLNPDDPYLHYDQARLHAQRGSRLAALDALDRLEAAGRRGAVAALLYHSLGTSDYGQAPSQREFREQLQALRDAGYRFLTPDQLKAMFAQVDPDAPTDPAGPPPRWALITFDDALVTAMEYGTPVGRELGIVFAQHIIVRNTHRGDAYLATWDELRDYQETGVWLFGSHSYYAHQEMPLTAEQQADREPLSYHDRVARVVPVDEVARRAYPLGNRIWRPDLDRQETRDDFIARLHEEYGRSQQDMQRELGVPVRFFAYPFGEIGQQAASNEPQAVQWNQTIAAEYYDMGFLQSPFGHAVYGDNPLLYQRHEMVLRATGEETVRYFIDHHPVYLAQLTRLQWAQEEGNDTRIREARAALEDSEYPYLTALAVADESAAPVERTRAYFGVPWRVERAGDPFAWNWSAPFVHLAYEGFSDNLDSRFHRISGTAGANAAPNVLVEGRAGAGHYEQETLFDEAVPDGNRTLSIDEIFAHVAIAARWPNGVTWSGSGGLRAWSGDADDTVPRLALQVQGFWRNRTEWWAGIEHDAVPAARAMADGLTQQTVEAQVMQPLGHPFLIHLAGRYHDISDGNARYHLDLAPSWQVPGDWPWRVGARYSYASSDQASEAYWTPYQTQSIYAEVALQQSRPGLYFSLNARIGLAEEAVRPESRRAFREREQQAAAAGFDPGPPPEAQGWVFVYGASAALTYEWTPRWAISGYVHYFESVDYNQTDIHLAVEHRF